MYEKNFGDFNWIGIQRFQSFRGLLKGDIGIDEALPVVDSTKSCSSPYVAASAKTHTTQVSPRSNINEKVNEKIL